MGKTRFISHIMGEKFKENSAPQEVSITSATSATKQVWLRQWDVLIVQIRYNIVDFSDSEINSPIHKFWLSQRCCYIIMFNLESPDTARMEYWLSAISQASGKTYSHHFSSLLTAGSTKLVLVVGTHSDKLKGTKQLSKLIAEKKEWQDKAMKAWRRLLFVRKGPLLIMPALIGSDCIFWISSKTGDGIRSFLEKLEEECGKQEMVRALHPATFKVRSLVQESSHSIR